MPTPLRGIGGAVLMFVEANEIDGEAFFESDVCIVGAGAAGISLFLALEEKGLTVNMLESGGFTFEAEVQELCAGKSVGAQYPLEVARLRYFGGSTNHWGGQCHRMFEMDFEPQPNIEHSGWPIRKADLDPYYDRALKVLEIAPGFERFDDLEKNLRDYPRLLGQRNESFEPMVWLKSPPTRMGKKYRPAIASSQRGRCFLHANAIELSPDEQGSTILRLEAKTLGGRRSRFKARLYVLCGGTVENARLLLLSDSVIPGGVGNRHDLVGRFFAEHAAEAFVDRMVLAAPPGKKGFQEEYLQQRAKAEDIPVSPTIFGWVATPALREKHSLMGFSVNPFRSKQPAPDSMEDAVAGLLAGRSEAMAAGEKRDVFSYVTWILAEEAPDPNNRVYLDRERDALGLRKMVLDWKIKPVDTWNMVNGFRLFAKELTRSGNGRVRIPEFDDFQLMHTLKLAGHQMGTTRMADDPRRGVTDASGKVHGVDNLYVAGGSVFPTYSFVNPTLTLVALTLRTADRIADRVVSVR